MRARRVLSERGFVAIASNRPQFSGCGGQIVFNLRQSPDFLLAPKML